MNPQRKQRLILILGVLLGIGGASAAVLMALKQNVQLFFTPSDLVARKHPAGNTFRLGGLVKLGSIKRASDSLRADFILTDCFHDVRARYEGILPDLFKEGQSAVATGKLNEQGVFVADQVLAKHDENYVPREMEETMKKAMAQKACNKPHGVANAR